MGRTRQRCCLTFQHVARPQHGGARRWEHIRTATPGADSRQGTIVACLARSSVLCHADVVGDCVLRRQGKRVQ